MGENCVGRCETWRHFQILSNLGVNVTMDLSDLKLRFAQTSTLSGLQIININFFLELMKKMVLGSEI